MKVRDFCVVTKDYKRYFLETLAYHYWKSSIDDMEDLIDMVDAIFYITERDDEGIYAVCEGKKYSVSCIGSARSTDLYNLCKKIYIIKKLAKAKHMTIVMAHNDKHINERIVRCINKHFPDIDIYHHYRDR